MNSGSLSDGNLILAIHIPMSLQYGMSFMAAIRKIFELYEMRCYLLKYDVSHGSKSAYLYHDIRLKECCYWQLLIVNMIKLDQFY